jgi:hypothetical protein
MDLVNQKVIGFHPHKCTFMLGTVTSRIKHGYIYLIEWTDQSVTEEIGQHLLTKKMISNQHEINNKTVAYDSCSNAYVLGVIKCAEKSNNFLEIEPTMNNFPSR